LTGSGHLRYSGEVSPDVGAGEAGLVVGGAPRLHAALGELARTARLVFFAGLPGTGKSLMIHQLAHLGHAAGRQVHLLQWDVARPVFDDGEAGLRYPKVAGLTHGMIRVAVGRWARQALVGWDRAHPEPAHLLIGESPFIGHRLVELARVASDASEPLLAASTTWFIVPVPSREVRRHLEAERACRAARPLHAREAEDAPPGALHAMWLELAAVARAIGLAVPPLGPGGSLPYDPETYERVYAHVLARRQMRALPVDTLLPTSAFSVYDFCVPTREVLPGAAEAAAVMAATEASFRDPAALQRQIDRWWDPDDGVRP
jgi:hypothetical protein